MVYTERMELLNSKGFEDYCRDMHQENCKERSLYNEKILTFEQYQEKNLNFLLDNFQKV